MSINAPEPKQSLIPAGNEPSGCLQPFGDCRGGFDLEALLLHFDFCTVLEYEYRPCRIWSPGHHDAWGFRTDYQFITKCKMKEIQKKSKGRESITTFHFLDIPCDY